MVSLYLLCVHDIFGLWTSMSPSQQYEETADLQDPARYLKLPFSKASLQPGNNQAIKNSKESFWIQSSLCSTKLTQNGERMFLLAICQKTQLSYLDLRCEIKLNLIWHKHIKKKLGVGDMTKIVYYDMCNFISQ